MFCEPRIEAHCFICLQDTRGWFTYTHTRTQRDTDQRLTPQKRLPPFLFISLSSPKNTGRSQHTHVSAQRHGDQASTYCKAPLRNTPQTPKCARTSSGIVSTCTANCGASILHKFVVCAQLFLSLWSVRTGDKQHSSQTTCRTKPMLEGDTGARQQSNYCSSGVCVRVAQRNEQMWWLEASE